MLTRCPHCQTTFRITEAHLEQAAGKVRCGQCHEVFDGRADLIEDESDMGEPLANAPSEAAVQEADYDEEDMEFIDLSAAPPPPADRQAPDASEDDTAAVPGSRSKEQDDGYNDLDAIGSVSVPGQLDMGLDKSLPEEDSLLSEEGFSIEQDTEDVVRLAAMAGELDKDEEQNAGAWSDEFESVGDVFPSPGEADAIRAVAAGIGDPAGDEISLSPASEQTGTEAQPTLAASKADKRQDSGIDDAVPYALRKDLLSEGKPRRHWALSLFYGLLAVVALAALAAQGVVFRNAELVNRWPQLRPLLSTACTHLPCYYAGPREVSRISLVNRDVRSHPDADNALLISATITNQAEFSQPYPNILITLSDLSGNVVAQRAFRPPEYLDRVYNRFVLMAPRQPVHIDLAVLDPGDDAVNFEFEFL